MVRTGWLSVDPGNFFLGQGQTKSSQEEEGSCAGQAALGRR